MKLYTERQMKEMFRMGLSCSINEDGALEQFNKIQLPSDEEMYINTDIKSENVEQHIGFIKGIQAYKEYLIQGGNNEQQ